ncbi:unnamed protein product [Linum trigynum]|uniref:Uncharacterized protein n=1 Tax=Linum trigynum TaxID=586398 RepID=A0AAV2G2K0_9ROSI
MEVSILSREIVKPSTLLPAQLVEPLKLNLLDQLTPMSYSPLVLFYPNNNSAQSSSFRNISNRLKWSLSEALSLYYPMAGRVRDNYAIHDFDQGIPYLETHVKGHLSDLLTSSANASVLPKLNDFLPLPTFRRAPDSGPQVAVQLNAFECGGLALGICSSHKTHDGVAGSAFLRSWAAINADHVQNVAHPSFEEGPLTFPPIKSMPRHYASLTEDLWFGRGGEPVMTRRFVFGPESVAELRERVKKKALEKYSTRAEAVSGFLWKSIIHASNSGNPTLFTQSVNLRRLTRPRLAKHSFGNLVLFSDSSYDHHHHGGNEQGARVGELAMLVRKGVSEMDYDYVERLRGEEGSEAIFEYYERQAEIEDGQTDVYNFSCWHGLDLTKTDFGWGPTVWVGLSTSGAGGGGDDDDDAVPYCSNSVVLMEDGRSKDGMEVWLTLEEPVMSALENDVEFLQFASSGSAILPPTCAS